MSVAVNHQIRLAQRPTGRPDPETWQLVEAPVPEPAPGTFVSRTRTISPRNARMARSSPDYIDRFDHASQETVRWITSGHITPQEQVLRGSIDAFPDAFGLLFDGRNTGKLMLELAP